ncbi:phage tail fiber protein, partial [Enterobacter hormaechei subsp. steigerwaltii]
MSVPNQTPYIIYNANGLTTVFPFEFYIINAGDIQVSLNGAVITTGYSVSGVGNVGGGDVTFLTPPANGTVVMLERVVPTYRLTDYQDNGDLLADTVNKDFDRLWMAIQRSFIYLGLALRRPLFGGPYDAEGYRISHLADPVDDQDAATKKWVLEKESANLNRALRVPENSVQPVPPLSERANKLLAFNDAGQPIAVLPPSGSASDVLIDLARQNGALLVGGAILECSTVAQAQAIVGLTEGRKVRTYYYNVPVVTDWVFTATQPAAPTFYITAVGGYLVFMGPATFAAAGLKLGDYVPADAWFNRNVMQGLMRDVRFSTFRVGFPGTYHVLGSVCPLRSNIFPNIEEGAYIVGHYNDSSIPNSDVSQSGGLFSFVKYADPDNGDFTLTGTLSNIHFVLDGDVKTVYSATNAKLHNNNCVGFYDVNNCSVRGRGGISGSDHRGICFDGKSVNCHIDINYISGTSDEPIIMRGDKTKAGHTNTIRVNNISGLVFDGPAKGVVINTAHNYYLDIWLGNYTGTSFQSVLVKNEDSLFTKVSVNYADNLTEVVRHYDAGSVVLDGGNYSNTISLVRRAGTGVTGICRDVVIKNTRALDTSLLYAFWAEINPDAFHALRIMDNDFSSAASSIRLYQNRITAGRPAIEDFRNNEMPSGYAPDASSFNPVLYTPLIRASSNILASEVTSFTYQYTGIYAFLSIQVRNTSSGVLDQLEIDLIGMVQSNSSRTMNTAAGNVTVARSINTITVTGAT